MRTWLLALMTVLVAFSGCFGGDDGGDDTTATPTATSTGTSTQTTTTTTSTTSTSTQTGEPESDENTPPTASISASIEQGQIPFDVNFTLDGADVDGDDLTWTFDADDDGETDAEGTELPAEYTHTYESEGLFNATLTVSDGTNETVQALTINATAAAASEGPIQEVSGTYISGPDSCAYLNIPPLGGTTDVPFDVDPATRGKAFVAVFTPTTPVVFLRVDYNNEAGDYVGVTELPPDADPEATEFRGTVPDDAATGSLSSCGGGEVSVVYTVG